MSQTILNGRGIVEDIRAKHALLYTKGYNQKELEEEHLKLQEELNIRLKEINFKDYVDFFALSEQEDINAEKTIEEMWK